MATNIAESSLTVPGVKTVIDFAMHRQNIYDDEAGWKVESMTELPLCFATT